MKKQIGCVIGIIIFPFILEWFLFITPEVSKFSNESWFSFIGSYTGAIATFLVLRITLSENRKTVEDEKKKLKRNYEIEKEIGQVEKILRVLLLDNYDFVSLNTIPTEYAKYIKDIQDVQYDVRKLIYEENGKTARDKFLMRVSLLERGHTLKLVTDEISEIDSIERAKQLYDFILNRTKELSRNANNQRKELLDLYQEYVNEMKAKEFE